MNDIADLREKMEKYFSLSELEGVAFDFGIDRDNLRHQTKPQFAMDLINYMGHMEKLPQLLTHLQKQRPHVNWQESASFDLDPQKFEQPPNATIIVQGNLNTGDTFNMSGDFRGAILNIKNRLTNVQQTVGAIPHGNDTDKEQLTQLIEQLKQAIEEIPAEQAATAKDDAEAVAETAKSLVELADSEEPNKTMIQITGEGLKKAAENLKAITPTILMIATQIVATISKIVGS